MKIESFISEKINPKGSNVIKMSRINIRQNILLGYFYFDMCREYLETFTKLVNSFLHVHSLQSYRVMQLTTAHAHSFASSFNAASCAKIKIDV